MYIKEQIIGKLAMLVIIKTAASMIAVIEIGNMTQLPDRCK
jgi:hypothetical protein